MRCTPIDLGDPQPAPNASPLHGSVPGVAGGCGQCCGTRQRCKSTAARAGSEPGDLTLRLWTAATPWQERAKMTEVSQNTPPWTAGGLPRTVPSSLSPGAARRAGRPHDASRPARAPASSSWRGGVRRATGRAWLAARADRTPTSSQRLGAARFPRRAAPTSTTSTASGLRADRAIVTSARQRPWPWAGACPGAAPPP